jgi:hypothetical protein
MTAFVAFVLGYILGVKTSDRDVEQLRTSLVALYGSEEFADVVSAVRTQVAGVLRSLADVAETGTGSSGGSVDGSGADLVATVRNLVGRD